MKTSGGVKKAKSKKGPGAKRRAKDLVDQFGCGRPVLQLEMVLL